MKASDGERESVKKMNELRKTIQLVQRLYVGSDASAAKRIHLFGGLFLFMLICRRPSIIWFVYRSCTNSKPIDQNKVITINCVTCLFIRLRASLNDKCFLVYSAWRAFASHWIWCVGYWAVATVVSVITRKCASFICAPLIHMHTFPTSWMPFINWLRILIFLFLNLSLFCFFFFFVSNASRRVQTK